MALKTTPWIRAWCFGFVWQRSLLKVPQILWLSFISHISHFSKGYSNVRLNVTKTRYQHTEFRVLLFIFPGIYRNRSDDTISLCSLPSGAYRGRELVTKGIDGLGWGVVDEVEDGMMGGYRERGGLRDDFTEGGEVARLLLEHRTEVSFSIKRERYPPSSWKDVIFGDLCVQSLLCCDGNPDSASSQCLAPLSSSNIHSPDQDCVFKYSFRTRSYDPGHPKSLPNKNHQIFRSSVEQFLAVGLFARSWYLSFQSVDKLYSCAEVGVFHPRNLLITTCTCAGFSALFLSR